MLLLTAEAATVFGATVWVLLRLRARSQRISMTDIAFYEHLTESGRSLAAKGQGGVAPPELRAATVGVAGTARESGVPVGIKLPYSPSAGPAVINARGVEGFEQSPLGAVVAAINLASRLAGVELLCVACSEAVNRHGEVALSGVRVSDKSDIPYEKGLTARRQRSGSAPAVPMIRRVTEEIREPTSFVPDLIEISGWQMERYSSGNAVVRYVLTRSGGGGGVVTTAMRVEVNWVDDDWKVVVPAAGDWSEALSTDVDTSRFTPFPARSSLPSPAR
ncbi:hypothetical protein MXD63_29110 [Frankia sp. Cpl3]|nr:hypothetical protein [Parafrankia colletiae]MCK9904099.1 hypothetical protein [Frankia sp. Cpl3]